MSKIQVSERKKEIMINAILNANFFIAGAGCFDLPTKRYIDFIDALLSNSPYKNLQKLYEKEQLN